MNTYDQFAAFLGSRAQRTMPSIKATIVRRLDAFSIAVRYHHTDVVIAHFDGTFTLTSGGYMTATTKARINDFSSARVRQLRGAWLVRYGVTELPFYDGIRVNQHGDVIPDEPRTAVNA